MEWKVRGEGVSKEAVPRGRHSAEHALLGLLQPWDKPGLAQGLGDKEEVREAR